MLEFISLIVLMLSLGTILYLVVRSLPRVEEDPISSVSVLDRMVSSEWPEKIDAALYSFLEKFIRKCKISLMKLDNLLTEHLVKIARGNGDKPKIDFNKINDKEEEDTPHFL